jgi:hypothetical protein
MPILTHQIFRNQLPKEFCIPHHFSSHEFIQIVKISVKENHFPHVFDQQYPPPFNDHRAHCLSPLFGGYQVCGGIFVRIASTSDIKSLKDPDFHTPKWTSIGATPETLPFFSSNFSGSVIHPCLTVPAKLFNTQSRGIIYPFRWIIRSVQRLAYFWTYT